MKIIFVGLHNKEGMKPLDSKTKSGKLIDRIIKLISEEHEIIKSNLYDINYFPTDSLEQEKLIMDWCEKFNPDTNTISVVLGAHVHKMFPYYHNVIKIAHPASKRSHKDMDEYVQNASRLIVSKINS